LGGEQSRVETIAAPFPSALDVGPRLPGEPALVLFGSAGWAPNRDQARWFVRSAWPAVRAVLPAARLHGFGGETLDAAGVEWHAAPQDSRSAFAEGSIFVVPLRLGSGVRMKILEAWARGVPVVATPEGAAGLAARAGEDLIVADPARLADEIVRLAGDPALQARLVASAREALVREHAPAVVGRAWQTLLARLPAR
jgi:glycosyltransferase involved in cell wall biosynthesis